MATPHQIYENLRVFIERRGYVPPDKLSEDELMSQLSKIGYVVQDAQRSDAVTSTAHRPDAVLRTGAKPDTIRVLLINGKGYAQGKKFSALVRQKKSGLFVVVVPSTFIDKNKNLIKEMESDPNTSVYDQQVFSLIIPDHTSVPPHLFASEEEIKKLPLTPGDLPKIHRHDPPVAWLGGRPGDVLRIDRFSETIGTGPFYRIVVE